MVSGMIDDYPDTFAVISVHIGGDGYDTPWGEDRADFYTVTGIPNFQYDGLEDAWPIGTYESKFLARQALPTDVTIAMTGEHISGTTYQITATVCTESGGSAGFGRLYMVQVLDHHPASPDYSRNCFKQAAGTEDFRLTPGECNVFERSFTFDGDSSAHQEDIKIIAWVQEKLDSGPAEVYQAATMTWPFPPTDIPGDLDGDGDVDLVDYAILEGCLDGPGSTTPPPGCDPTDFANADLEGEDEDVDEADFGVFTLNFTGSL